MIDCVCLETGIRDHNQIEKKKNKKPPHKRQVLKPEAPREWFQDSSIQRFTVLPRKSRLPCLSLCCSRFALRLQPSHTVMV